MIALLILYFLIFLLSANLMLIFEIDYDIIITAC